jgi:hypothetical protein
MSEEDEYVGFTKPDAGGVVKELWTKPFQTLYIGK